MLLLVATISCFSLLRIIPRVMAAQVNEYEIIRALGEGEYGEVFLVELRVPEREPQAFAMKRFSKSRLGRHVSILVFISWLN